MDGLLDRLRLLKYSTTFCPEKGLRPLTPGFFTLPQPNVNVQLHYFHVLFAWLANQAGDAFSPPGELDDPNQTATSIAAVLKNAGVPGDFAVAKLRQGHGEAVLQALTGMADRVLKVRGYQFKKPVFSSEDTFEEAEADDDAEVRIDDIEEALVGDGDAGSDDDHDDHDVLGALAPAMIRAPTRPVLRAGGSMAQTSVSGLRTSNAFVPPVDAAVWQAELDRVTPLLKVQLTADHKDWRMHLAHLQQYQGAIAAVAGPTRDQLAKLNKEIEQTLDKIESREKYINAQFETLVEEHRGVQQALSGLKQKYNASSEQISKLSAELAQVSEQLDTVKAQMDDLGSGMTDSKPLINIKSALQRLKTEIKQMDLRTGVLEHTLLNVRLKNKATMVAGAAEGTAAPFLFAM
ncbi:Intraflagellar transport protein 57 [Allomyces arbusculus]|nr:Intraflagellar transport protein 57 [Allomyces arbusculus]